MNDSRSGTRRDEGMVYDLPSDLRLNMTCVPKNTIDFKVHSFGYFADESPFEFPFPVLMLQIFVCMFVSRALYYLLRPLKQPRIISDLLVGGVLSPPEKEWSIPYSDDVRSFCAPLRTTMIGDHGQGGMLLSPSLLNNFVVGRDDKGNAVTLWSKIFPEKHQAVVRTMANVGLMFYLFLIGVKMDLTMIFRSTKKIWFIGISSLFVPFFVNMSFFLTLPDKISGKITKSNFIVPMSVSLSSTQFPVLADVLADLQLLNSELGRLAMSCALVNGLFIFVNMGVFVAINQMQGGWLTATYALLSLGLLVATIVFAFRPWMQRIARRTPRGGRIEERQIFMIFACVIAMGVLSDYVGASFVFVPLIMGLCVPDGPPLGSALVERAQLLSGELLMPLLYLVGGQEVVFKNYSAKAWLLLVVLCVSFVTKLIATVVPTIYCNVSLENAFLLGIIMNFRGLIEMITFLSYRAGNLLGPEAYTVTILWSLISTGIAGPIVTKFYKPMINNYNVGHRSIQHLKPNMEFRLLACVINENPVSSIVNLLEASHSGEETPLCAYVLHLVELVGRATSSLIAHKNKKGFINPTEMDRLHNVFINYEQNKKGYVAVQPFTSVTPFKTMHQDICALAAEKNVALVVVPFRRVTSSMEYGDLAMRSNIPHILAQAPCTVGILVYLEDLAPSVTPLPGNFQHQLGVLFWGGPDDREALAYASRMVRRSGVSLTIVHFMQPVDRRDIKQRQLDDDMLSRVRFENMNNEHVVVDEVVVRDVEQTITVIKSLGNSYNLMIVGRRQGPNTLLDEGLAEWSECPELGVVGDILASKDFESSSAVLVVQQQQRGR